MSRMIPMVAALALTASIAGCGSDGSNEPAPAAKRPAATASQTLTLKSVPGDKALFDKGALTAKPGPTEIVLKNIEDVPHNIRLTRGTKCCMDKGGPDIGGTKTILEGTTKAVVDLEPGKYTYYCSIGGHWQQGMRGLLTVRS